MRDPLADPRSLIPRVYAYVAYRVGDGPDAEDITSETFERALRYRASFNGSRGEVGAWLIGIARRCVADAAGRSLATLEEVPDQETLAHDESVVRRLELRAAVSRLDLRDAELIALRYAADLTARQIGDLLGLKTNAVEVALHRALARLRECLDNSDDSASARGAPIAHVP